jgi:hypothetical protein
MNYLVTIILPFNVQLNFTISQSSKDNFVSWFKNDEQENFYLIDINNNVNFIRKTPIYAIKIVGA